MENFRSAQILNSGINVGLRAYMLRVYNYMFVALGLTALVSWVFFKLTFVGVTDEGIQVTQLGAILLKPMINLLFALGLMGLLFYLNFNLGSMSIMRARQLFFLYAALMGITLAPVAIMYTGTSIARTFLITSVSFGSLSLYGYTTKRDLSSLSTFLMMGVVGIFLAMIVNIFMQSSALDLAVSVVGVLVFAGLTAYDTQNIKSMYFSGQNYGDASDRKAIFGAIQLYLDFLNMFLFFLRFTGDRR